MSLSSILVHAFRWIQQPSRSSHMRNEAWFVIRHNESGEPSLSQVFRNLPQDEQPGFTFAGPSCALVGSSLYVIGQNSNSPRPQIITRLDTLNQAQGWKQCNPLPFSCVGTKPYVLGKFIYLFPSSSNGGCFLPIHDRQIPWGLLYDTIEQKCYKIEPPSGLHLLPVSRCEDDVSTFSTMFLENSMKCEPEAERTEDDPYWFHFLANYHSRESDAESDNDVDDSAFDGDADNYDAAQTPPCPPPFCVALDGADPRLIVSIPMFHEKQLRLHNPVKNEWEPYFDDNSSHRQGFQHHAVLNGILYSCDTCGDSNPFISLSAYDMSRGWRCLFGISIMKPKNLNLRCGSVSLVAIADFHLCLLWVKANSVRSKKNVLCYTKIVVSVDPSRATHTFSEEKFLEIEANGLLSCLPC